VRHTFSTPFTTLFTLTFAINTQSIRAQNPPASPQTPAQTQPSPNPAALAVMSAAGPATSARALERELERQPRSPARTAAAVPLREQAKSPRAQAAARQDLSPWPSQRHHTVQPIKLKLEESGRAPDLDSETSARPGIKVRSGPNSCLDTSS
jgi:hypothetical protein